MRQHLKLLNWSSFRQDEQDEDNWGGVGIRKFCPTRWTVRGESIKSIIENYNVLKELWVQCLELNLQPDVKGRIIGVQTQMLHFKFLFGLKLCERILLITDNLSKTLQKQSLFAAEGQEVASLTVKTLESMRNESDFHLFFQHLETLRAHTETDVPCLPRRRTAPQRLEIGEGVGYHASSVEEYYRAQYFEALDLAICGIKDRFDQPGYETYKNLEQLLLKAANKKEYSYELQEVIKMYENDFNEAELTAQLQLFGANFSTDSNITIREAIDFLKDLSTGKRQFFNQVCRIAELILVMPSTNAASERSFSVMNRVKNYLRSTMNQGRLNHVMILTIYKQFLDNLDLITTANEFMLNSEHRSQIFGTFV